MNGSVSATVAIVFVGFVIMITALYPIVASRLEGIFDTLSGAIGAPLASQKTSFEFESVSYEGAGTLTVKVNNSGTKNLSVNEPGLLVDNTHWTGIRAVEGHSDADVWFPGERLTITVGNLSMKPVHVEIVSDHGVTTGEYL